MNGLSLLLGLVVVYNHCTKLLYLLLCHTPSDDEFMDGCRAAVPENDRSSCYDDYRLNMNRYQPSGMRVSYKKKYSL